MLIVSKQFVSTPRGWKPAADMAPLTVSIRTECFTGAQDADPGGGPLHQLLGASRPARGYGELLRGRAQDFSELVCDTPIAGVRLVGGENSIFGSMKAKQSAKTVSSRGSQFFG